MPLKVRIPTYRRIDDSSGKSYTVFCIESAVSGKSFTVERRYSEFAELNRKLKLASAGSSLPPKSVRKWNHKVLQHRREALESYLQAILKYSSMPAELKEFLSIDNTEIRSEKLVQQPRLPLTSHQPLVGFSEDNFFQQQSRGSLPDIVMSGVTQGFYCNVIGDVTR